MAGPAVAADGGGREATGRRLGVSRLGMLIVSLLCGVILHASSALGATCGYAAARLFPTCGMAISATEGEQFSGAVGTVSNLSFTVGRRALTELVTIDWGDGSSSTVQLPQHEGLRPIAEPVDASHVYAEEGSYAISWRASFLVGGRPIAVLPAGSGSATVADAPLAARSLTFAASVGQRFEGVVATFEDGDPGGAASDFSASIEWGDGTSSEGTVSQSGSSFVVSGVHTYRDPQLAVDSVEGADGPVHVSISDAGGASATTVSHVHVPLQASMAAVKPGSVSVVSLPLPLESVASIASAGGGPTGVSAYASSGELVLAASVEASAGEEMLAISGEGCISAGCGIHFDIDVPVDVTALAAPEGVALESFDTISPERLAEASPLPDGGARLPDELIVMTGTDDQPSDRASADAAAAAVEGTITGGVESEGVYEIRWKSPQDLAERVAELQAVPGVSAVSYEDVGTVSGDAVTPEDWGDLGEAAIWPAYQVEAPEAWEEAGVLGWDGGEGGRARATVGIVDVGLVDRYHPDLNVVQTIAPAGEGWMIGGHATRVAGLACAEANGFGIVGIGWGCPIVTSSVIAQPPNPNGAPCDTWGAAFRAAAKVAQTHPKAINMSLGINPANAEGHDQCATAQQLRDALAERVSWAPEFHRLFARTKGILWTLSAGNACVPYALSPMAAGAAGLRNVVVVAATNSDGHLASFSNFGPKKQRSRRQAEWTSTLPACQASTAPHMTRRRGRQATPWSPARHSPPRSSQASRASSPKRIRASTAPRSRTASSRPRAQGNSAA